LICAGYTVQEQPVESAAAGVGGDILEQVDIPVAAPVDVSQGNVNGAGRLSCGKFQELFLAERAQGGLQSLVVCVEFGRVRGSSGAQMLRPSFGVFSFAMGKPP
jgi:hypothetical protein